MPVKEKKLSSVLGLAELLITKNWTEMDHQNYYDVEEAFQSGANHLLANKVGGPYMNKFEQVRRAPMWLWGLHVLILMCVDGRGSLVVTWGPLL